MNGHGVMFPVTRRQPQLMRHALLARVAAVVLLTAGFANAEAATHTVVIEGMSFQPAVIEVKAGDTIVWENKDIVPHTVTAKAPHVESGEIGMGKSWTYQAKKPGTIHYICRYHPMMQAKIVVTK